MFFSHIIRRHVISVVGSGLLPNMPLNHCIAHDRMSSKWRVCWVLLISGPAEKYTTSLQIPTEGNTRWAYRDCLWVVWFCGENFCLLLHVKLLTLSMLKFSVELYTFVLYFYDNLIIRFGVLQMVSLTNQRMKGEASVQS
jgi:hypothetical protein